MNKERLYIIEQTISHKNGFFENRYLVTYPKFEGVGLRATVVGVYVEVEDEEEGYVMRYRRTDPHDLLITGTLRCEEVIDEKGIWE